MANKLPWLIAFVLHIVGFVLCCIGYGTGYWYEADDYKGRDFHRLGLWEACFDGYEHTSDYIGKAYHGCWWIFHKEYSYIRGWIMPSWFIAVQTLMTFAIVCEFLLLALIPVAASEGDSTRPQSIASAVSGFQSACIAISVSVFAIMIGEDRTWMPRWDINILSWSFGLVCVAGFLSVFECVALTTYTLMRKYELMPKDEPLYPDKPKPYGMPGVPKV